MMLFLELAVLVLLFLLFRLLIRQIFPKRARVQELSPESLKALRRFQFKQGLSTILLTVLFSLAWYALFIALAEWLLPLFYPEQLFIGIQHNAYLQPALVLGLTNAIWLSPKLIAYWNKDGLEFFYKELEDILGGYKSSRFSILQVFLGVSLSLLMLYGQFNTYILLGDEKLFWKKGLRETDQRLRSEVTSLSMKKGLLMVFDNGDTLSFNGFHYEKPMVEEWYKKGR